MTPLFTAAQKGHEAVVRALIEAGADINKADDGATPLFMAAQDGHDTVVRLLIEAGVDVNKAKDIGATPFYATSQVGYETIVRDHAAVVQILRDAGAA